MTTANAYDFTPSNLSRRSHSARPGLQLLSSELQDPILQALPAAVILLDQRGQVYQANPAAVSMLGEPLVGQRWFAVISRCFRPRSDDGLEVSLKDGRLVKLEISALLSRTEYTEPGQLIMLTDLTQTRQLQGRLSQMQRLSTLGKMMASLAHQIRTPLSAAMLYAQNLGNPRATLQVQQQFQQKLLSRLQDLEQQLNDMLLFARSGTAQAVTPVSCKELAEQVVTATDAVLQQSKAVLTVSVAEPALTVLGNLSALSGALQNLIYNSVQAMSAATQADVARVQLTIAPAACGMLSVQVTDNGPGVAAHLQNSLFDPFVTGRADGTGLGLAVVQAVAAAHSGSVQYHNIAGGGACFELLLPLHASTTETEQGSAAL
ncbi:PAS domain-containing protein [Rheinheimera sp. YQF-2]|uniref:histidine kinase n=1 Tax=Rheinheimera lutimaris TaxID=2740584 RepID=A0A7Y5EHB8_9GAMM|nr:ATP-binding protein [Rheinheimera lutimaris]NRQ42300.1 PAS domain-containing protein [Rheinheimera lutimaris]